MLSLGRRQFLTGAAGLALAAGGVARPLMARAPQEFDLTSRRTSFTFGGVETKGLISTRDNAPPPVLRVRQGQRAVFNFTNGLDEYSTLHWHGLRIPNAMDGVPYLTQIPVGQGETFRYDFTPPDAGTHWYHPHCQTMQQMAQGLTGMLVVQEAKDPGFDADIALNLKDFRLDADGQLLPFFTPRGAARAGTLGNLKTTNWRQAPVYDVPAGGLVRLRVLVSDTTRVYKLILPDMPAGVTGRVIAWDGQPVDAPVPWPSAETPLWLGPGQRVDLAIVMPGGEGQEVPLQGLIGRNTRFPIASLRATGASLGRAGGDIPTLPKNPIAEPDVAAAQVHEILFGWSPEGDGANNGLCGSYEYTFWSINRSPWPGDAAPGVGPVATLAQGQSHILRLRNGSPNLHPVHLHGLVFRPIRSNLRKLPSNYTDTVLLLKNEVIDVALHADNPGDWAFHCHVIEHQKTGLSGFIRVA